MRRSILVIVVLAFGCVAHVQAQKLPDTKQQLLIELTLPPLVLPTLAKIKYPVPDLKTTDMKLYADNGDPKSVLRKAVRAAQVALWASSPEAVPAPLQAEVQAVRKKLKLDPARLRMRYEIPANAEADQKLKAELLADVKQLARLCAQLEDVFEELKEAAGGRAKEGPRWQAHFDLLTMWVLLRLVALEEQQTGLGILRKDYPDYDTTRHKSFQMIPDEKLQDFASKKYYKQAAMLRQQIAKERKNTAWDKLASEALEAHLSNRWLAVP